MDGPSIINSKASAIKSLLLNAWRCKWSEAEWAHGIRKVLPRGVNGDVYDLADCILKQALIGPAPNELFISYLNYSIKTKLVSHGSVLAAIARSCDDNLTQNKPLAMICLLEFVKAFRDHISCSGSEEDCIHLCRAVGDILHWLIKCIYNSIQKICSNSSITSTANTLVAQQLQQQQQQQTNNINQQNVGGFVSGPTNRNNNSNNNNPTPNNPNNSLFGINNPNNVFSGVGTYHPSSEYHQVIILATEIIAYLIGRPFTMALLYIFRLEYEQKFQETIKTFDMVENTIKDSTVVNSIQGREHLDVIANFSRRMNSLDSHPSVVAAKQLRNSSINHGIHHNNKMNSYHKSVMMDVLGQLSHHLSGVSLDSSPSQALFACLYSLIAFDVVFWPARDIRLVANQIATIKDSYNLPLSSVYCEIIRICLTGSIDAKKTTEDGKWAVFTFLKMPHLLKELNRICNDSPPKITTAHNSFDADTLSGNGTNNNNTKPTHDQSHSQYALDLTKAIEKLNGYTPLLDLADTKCNCDFLGCLVKELSKTESSLSSRLHDLVSARQAIIKSRPTMGTQESGHSGLHTVLKAEPTMISILRTLDTDYSKDQAQLLRVLCQMVNGKSFELILSAAAASGKLQAFTSKLIEFNETNKRLSEENSRSSLLRSLLFDITFLMLCHIANNYGCDVIAPKDRNSAFASWYLKFYNSSTRLNCPKQLLIHCDSKKVDLLIKQLMNLTSEQNTFQTINIDWHEVCENIPAAVSEILNAWQHELISDAMIKMIVDKIKSKMCFLGLVIASWLRAHIKTLGSQDRKKSLAMLQELMRYNSSTKQYQQNSQCNNNSPLKTSTENSEADVTNQTAPTTAPLSAERSNSDSGNNNQSTQDKDSISQACESFRERSSLMCHIIKKIYNELAPSPNSISSHQASASFNNNESSSVDAGESQTGDTVTSGSQSSSQQIHLPNNKRFFTTLSTNEILAAELGHSLERGWTDLKSLHTFEALTKLIGYRSFANIIVERILLLESPSELNRAVDIVFGLFHLNIEEFALALIEDTIVDNLICEQKQSNLIQPRAYALARLSVMTIIEAIRHLKYVSTSYIPFGSQENEQNQNKPPQSVKIKEEPGFYNTDAASNNGMLMMGHESDFMMITESDDPAIDLGHIDKKSKIDSQSISTNGVDKEPTKAPKADQLPIFVPKRDSKAPLANLESSLVTLMRLFKRIMSDTCMSQRTLFPVLFLEQTVICAGKDAHDITKLTPPYILMDIIKLFSNELTFELALAISNLSTTESRWATARAICELASKRSVLSSQNRNTNETDSFEASHNINDNFSNPTNNISVSVKSEGPQLIRFSGSSPSGTMPNISSSTGQYQQQQQQPQQQQKMTLGAR